MFKDRMVQWNEIFTGSQGSLVLRTTVPLTRSTSVNKSVKVSEHRSLNYTMSALY